MEIDDSFYHVQAWDQSSDQTIGFYRDKDKAEAARQKFMKENEGQYYGYDCWKSSFSD